MYVQYTLDVIGFNGVLHHSSVIKFFGDSGGKGKAVAPYVITPPFLWLQLKCNLEDSAKGKYHNDSTFLL